ncbi:hypothetical protein JXR01_01945 [Candidatus Kaiserbacteria bacterium]|nr:MAG: hypothetical protein JXR01_01945 [Candidatus Kaiserbacteria bacterium]
MLEASAVNRSRVETRTTGFGPAEIQLFSGAGDIDWSVDRSKLDTFDEILGVTPPNIQKLWMPRPTEANGELAPQGDFSPLFDGHEHPIIMGNCDADGCIVRHGDAFGLLSADCATLVAYADDMVIAAHAGRDSVMDRTVIAGGDPSRDYSGILESIVVEFLDAGYRPQDVHLGIFGGIQSNFLHDPTHPEYGEYNRGLIHYAKQFEGALINEEIGDINMNALIRAKATQIYGINPDKIIDDGVDSGSDRDAHGNLLWASHRHAKNGHRERNFILVRHTQ